MMAISILGNVLSKERKQISGFDFADRSDRHGFFRGFLNLVLSCVLQGISNRI